MTDFADFKQQIAEWSNRQDWSDALVTQFVRMAEQKLNAELRVDRMIQNNQALIASGCAPLPDDWLEMELIRIADPNAADGFAPIKYMARDEFFRQWASSTNQNYLSKYYTIEGRQIYFGGAPDTVNGTQYKISYFGEVPVFSDAQSSWIYSKHPSLYLFAALLHAVMHAVGEEQSAANFKQLAEDMIQKLNADFHRARASGSRVNRSRVRSFG